MPNVALSEDLYRKAAQVADASGMSVDEYVAHALQAEFEDEREAEPLMLTPEQTEGVRRGLEDVRAGRVLTIEEAERHMEQRKAAWLAEHPL